MKNITAEEYGIYPSYAKDTSQKLQKLFDEAKTDCSVVLTPGTYFLDSGINLAGLKNVDIRAYGVKFVTRFNTACPYDGEGAFTFENCENCNIYGMSFETENPVNVTARITAIDLNNNSFDARLTDGCYMRGDEKVMCLDTCNEIFTPNMHIFCADNQGYKYEKIDCNAFRFYIPHPEQLKAASVGELLLIKHSLYAAPPFTFIMCRGILLEDITVYSTPGICCVIHPRSADFTFRRFNVRLPQGSKRICASQTDGIQIKGMSGRLIMEDCHFEYMGDDALNIHNRAGTVYGYDGNEIKVGIAYPTAGLNELPKELLPEAWAQKGDKIYVYDADTLKKTGEFTVEGFETKGGYNVITACCLKGELKKGCKLANSEYYAEVQIRNCSVEGSRARGFLIQTENITVENCKFYGITSAGIMLACDVKYWNEMGPAKNVLIRNNVFEYNGINHNPLLAGGITVGVAHHNMCGKSANRKDVHRNIRIINNRFVNLKDSAIYADGVTGLEIADNEMTNCCCDKEERMPDYCNDAVLFNCDDVTFENNFNASGKKVTVNNLR